MVKPKTKIGKNFMRLLKEGGFRNLFHFQKKTGFPYSTAYELATGQTRNHSMDTLRQIAKCLKMDVGALLVELTK